MSDKWEEMRDELERLTLKQLRALAKNDGITLGYDASRKDSAISAIITARRYQELNGFVPKGYDWHTNGVTAFGGIKSW